jgi:hypothetical protein
MADPRARTPHRQINALLAEFSKSGTTQRAFCERRGLNLTTFRSWLAQERRQPRMSDARPQSHHTAAPTQVVAFPFAPLAPPFSGNSDRPAYRIEFADGTLLHIPASLPLSAVVDALRPRA